LFASAELQLQLQLLLFSSSLTTVASATFWLQQQLKNKYKDSTEE
jgi:hypothetical protein